MQLFLIRRISLPQLEGEAQADNISIPTLHSDVKPTKALSWPKWPCPPVMLPFTSVKPAQIPLAFETYSKGRPMEKVY